MVLFPQLGRPNGVALFGLDGIPILATVWIPIRIFILLGQLENSVGHPLFLANYPGRD